MTENISRRTFLKSALGAAVAASAGCTVVEPKPVIDEERKKRDAFLLLPNYVGVNPFNDEYLTPDGKLKRGGIILSMNGAGFYAEDIHGTFKSHKWGAQNLILDKDWANFIFGDTNLGINQLLYYAGIAERPEFYERMRKISQAADSKRDAASKGLAYEYLSGLPSVDLTSPEDIPGANASLFSRDPRLKRVWGYLKNTGKNLNYRNPAYFRPEKFKGDYILTNEIAESSQFLKQIHDIYMEAKKNASTEEELESLEMIRQVANEDVRDMYRALDGGIHNVHGIGIALFPQYNAGFVPDASLGNGAAHFRTELGIRSKKNTGGSDRWTASFYIPAKDFMDALSETKYGSNSLETTCRALEADMNRYGKASGYKELNNARYSLLNIVQNAPKLGGEGMRTVFGMKDRLEGYDFARMLLTPSMEDAYPSGKVTVEPNYF